MSDMTRDQILAAAKAKYRAAQTPDIFGDIGASASAGGLTGFAGALDQAQNIIEQAPGVGPLAKASRAGVDYLTGGASAAPQLPPDASFKDKVLEFINPSNGPAQAALRSVSPGSFTQQPETVPGEYAKTISSFLGGDIPFMGAGGIVRSAIGDVAGGALSEGLGQLERRSGGDETWARIIGAVVGSGSVAGIPTRSPAMRAGNIAKERGFIPAIPGLPGSKAVRGAISPEALQLATDAFYDHLRQQGITYNPQTWQTRLTQLHNQLDKKIHGAPGPRGNNMGADPAFEWISRELTRSMQGPLDFNDMQKLSSTVGDLMRDADTAGNTVLAKAYRRIRNSVDDYMVNATGNLVYGPGTAPGSLKMRAATYKTAKALALRNIKQERLSKMLERAQDYGHGDFIQGLTNQINNELRDSVDTRFWSANEKKLLRDVRDGNRAVNTLGVFGVDLAKANSGGLPQAVELGRAAALSGGVSGTGYGLPMVFGGAGSPLGLAAGVGTALAGTVANSAKPIIARGRMNSAMEAIRGGELQQGFDKTARMASRRRARQALAVMHGINANGGTGEGTPMPGAIRG